MERGECFVNARETLRWNIEYRMTPFPCLWMLYSMNDTNKGLRNATDGYGNLSMRTEQYYVKLPLKSSPRYFYPSTKNVTYMIKKFLRPSVATYALL